MSTRREATNKSDPAANVLRPAQYTARLQKIIYAYPEYLTTKMTYAYEDSSPTARHQYLGYKSRSDILHKTCSSGPLCVAKAPSRSLRRSSENIVPTTTQYAAMRRREPASMRPVYHGRNRGFDVSKSQKDGYTGYSNTSNLHR